MKLINFISPGRLKIFLTECKKIFAPISHTHKTSDVENLDENLNNKYDKTTIQKQGTVLASPSDKDGVASFRKLTKKDIDLGDVAQIIHLTKSEYDELEKNGQLNPEVDYITTDESDNITDSSVQLWNTSSSLAQQGKYLSYSDQNGGKYLSLMNSSDNTAVAHAKLMDGESGEGMDVDADKVKTVDSKGILVEALGETTAQALIDEVAKRVIDLTGRMSTTETGLQSANDAITSLNSKMLDERLTQAEGKITQLNSEASARWNNATPKTLWINVIPSAINTDYKYQHNSLIGANMVSLAFESAVYDILILTGNGRTYGTTVANTFTDDPYWKSTIQASFDSNTGTVTFRILFKGSSQIFNNLALKAVTYLKIG